MTALSKLQHRCLTRQLSTDAARTLSRHRGMTLIEIMIVVAIISLVLGGVSLMAFNQYKEAQISTAKKDAVQVQQAIELYMTQKRGKCPKTLQDLKASGVAAKVTTDPWGNDYEFKCPGEKTSVDVISGGPDGEIGTEDDITNFEDESSEANKE